MNEFDNAIALTGGISTGKSTVCNLLKLHGFFIIDADKIAHQVLNQNSHKISEIFGEEFVDNGVVNRKKLGTLVFGNPSAKASLQELVHPLIKAEIKEQAKLCEEKKMPYIVDIPLFFETRNYPIEKCVVVYCSPEIQLERLMKRDNISKDEAVIKISNQMDIEQKKSLAKYVIDNSKDIKALQKQVEKFIKEVQ